MSDFSLLFKNAETEPLKMGAVLFEPGSTGKHMYVVRSGRVAIELHGETVETVEAGGFIGEMSLLDDVPRSTRAVALTDCEVVPVDQRRFLFLIQETPFFAINVMKVMARRLRAMNARSHPTPA